MTKAWARVTLWFLLLAGGLSAGSAAPAGGVPLIGNQTTVDYTSRDDILGAGLAFSASPTHAITGGDLTLPDLEGTVEHAGSSIRINEFFGNSVQLTELEFDLTGGLVRADVLAMAPGSTVANDGAGIFGLRACSPATPCAGSGGDVTDGFALDWTVDAANLVNQFLPAAGLSGGVQFGVATLDLAFVPEPGTAALLAAGLLGLAAARRP